MLFLAAAGCTVTPAAAHAAVGDLTSVPVRTSDSGGNVGIASGPANALTVVDPGYDGVDPARAAKIWTVATDPVGGQRAVGARDAGPVGTRRLGRIAAVDLGVAFFDAAGGISRSSERAGNTVSFALPGSAAGSIGAITTTPGGDVWWATSLRPGGPVIGRLAAGRDYAEEWSGTAPSSTSTYASATLGLAATASSLWSSASLDGALRELSTADGSTVREVPVPDLTGAPFPPDGNGAIAGPTGLTLGPDGNVWFNHFAGQVGRVTPAGVVQSFPKLGDSGTGLTIATGADGALWYSIEADDGSGRTPAHPARVGRMTTTGAATEWDLPSGHAIADLTAGPDGAMWATDSGGPALLRIETGAPGAVAKPPIVTRDGRALTCAGEQLAAWPSTEAPRISILWSRDGTLVPSASGRTLTPTDAGSYGCTLAARFPAQRVSAQASSSNVVRVDAVAPQPPVTPTPTPAPSTAPTVAPTSVPTTRPLAELATPTPKPVATATARPFASPKPAARVTAQVITCKYTRAGARVRKTTCVTTLSTAPQPASSRAKSAKLVAGKSSYPVTVIAGSSALRIVSTKVLPKATYGLKLKKLRWKVSVS